MENYQELSFEDQIELFKKSIATDQDRVAFAASVAVPLRQSVAAKSTVRQIFEVDELPPGAYASYPVDFEDIDAWVLPAMGQVPQNIIAGEELHIPTFEIASSAEWGFSYARDGRFNVAQRALQKLEKAIIEQEEEAGWATIRAAVRPDRTISSAEFTSLSKDALNAMFKKMQEIDGYNVTVIACNSVRAGDIREWGQSDVDDTTRREIWRNAGLGSIWGAQILVVPRLKNDEVYAFDTSRMGIMPIRENIKTFDDPSAVNKLRVRIIGYEDVGFAVVDPKAIVKLDLS